MNLIIIGRKIFLKLFMIKNKICSGFQDMNSRNFMKFVQFVSINKKSSKKLYEKYILNQTQTDEIDVLYKESYGKKISYNWHQYFLAFSDTFTKNYIPMSIYLSEVEYFMNPYKEYIRVFENKSIISLLAKSIGINSPRSLFTCSSGQILDSEYKLISKKELISRLQEIGNVFIKPTVDSCSGMGCYCCNIVGGGVDQVSNRNIEDIINEMGENFVVQNIIKNHNTISKIYSKSLNTFRVVTYQWKESIYNAPVIMRLGRNGSLVDNACHGGIYIAVDNDGKLHKTAHSTNNEKLNFHPDSHIEFENYKIISIQNVIEAAKKMHRALPMLGIVNWDFTIDEQGEPVLIEANISGGGVWMIQIAHGSGLFEERTEEILRWLKLMKSLSIVERKKYYFGKNL